MNKKLLKQIMKFVVVGGVATIIDFVFLYIFKEIVNLPIILSNTLSFIISVIYNYIASIKWVFDVSEEKNKRQTFLMFIVFSVIGLILNDLIMHICISNLRIYYLISKLVATAIVMVFNFITRKMFLE